jgi:aarF domain-containing kinase
MQTDPNWSNFLFNQKSGKVRACFDLTNHDYPLALLQIELLDFGASRAYTKSFMDDWYLLLSAAINGDRKSCEVYSLKLKYITGEESPVRSGYTLISDA